jgi:hypothetical protein
MTVDEHWDRIEAALLPHNPKCVKCGGKGTVPYRMWTTYETDTPEEHAAAWGGKPCPDCVVYRDQVRASLDEVRREMERLRDDAKLYHEIVKRLHGAYVAAGFLDWTEWQAAIDLFLKAAQAQAQFARLASQQHDKILDLERQSDDLRAEIARLRKALDYINLYSANESDRKIARAALSGSAQPEPSEIQGFRPTSKQ